MSAEIDEFLLTLNNYFPDKFPEDVEIVSGDSLEHMQVESYFQGKKWEELSLDTLNNYEGDPSACLWFMTPEALRYYLPAYLKVSLVNYQTSDAIPDSVVNILLRSAEEPSNRKDWGLDDLDIDQKKVISNYLMLMDKEFLRPYSIDSAKRAFDLYWGQFA